MKQRDQNDPAVLAVFCSCPYLFKPLAAELGKMEELIIPCAMFGGPKMLNSPTGFGERAEAIRKLSVALEMFFLKKILIIGEQKCLLYGDCHSDQEERSKMAGDLVGAKNFVAGWMAKQRLDHAVPPVEAYFALTSAAGVSLEPLSVQAMAAHANF